MSISVDEFKKLEREPSRTKVSEQAILEAISKSAKTCTQVADELGQKYPTIYARLNTLVEEGEVVKRYQGRNALYLNAEALV